MCPYEVTFIVNGQELICLSKCFSPILHRIIFHFKFFLQVSELPDDFSAPDLLSYGWNHKELWKREFEVSFTLALTRSRWIHSMQAGMAFAKRDLFVQDDRYYGRPRLLQRGGRLVVVK